MAESMKSRLLRYYFNFFPAYRRTGARVTYIRKDLKEIKIRLPLNWKTKNYVGTLFGGSMFAAVDPIYMVMLIRTLGSDYIVWDKSAEIKFLRPGNETVYGHFLLENSTLSSIKDEVNEKKEINFSKSIRLETKNGKAVCEVVKNIYIADKSFYDERRSRKKSKS